MKAPHGHLVYRTVSMNHVLQSVRLPHVLSRVAGDMLRHLEGQHSVECSGIYGICVWKIIGIITPRAFCM